MAAAILGIVASLVGPAIELGKCIAKPIKRRYDYFRHFDNNIEKLGEEAGNLKVVRDGLQMRVNTAMDNVEKILPEVNNWFDNVNKILEENTRIERENAHMQRGCLAVKSRILLSKKAEDTAKAMKELRDGRPNFSDIALPISPVARESIPLRPKCDFPSRKDIEEDIVKALKEFNMVGICGMGGVGKTTMAKRVMSRLKEEGFVETVMVVVSQNIDKLKIQNEIAEQLHLKLEDLTMLLPRAHKLYTRLTCGKKILIVLDDVWEILNLEELGIPCEIGSKGCKILLTSRGSDVLNEMEAQKICGIQTLHEEEAWSLFKQKVGPCVEDQNLLSIAQEVAKECKGLPIALVTIGGALKNQGKRSVWEDALRQLKDSNPEDMPKVIKGVYRPLKVSYDKLESDHAKSLFLLCCLYPEDAYIPMRDLTFYVMGLRILEANMNVEQARNSICSLVEMLKNHFLLLDGHFLLLDGEYEYHVRMHDVVRDVAIFIASRERQLIKCRDKCTWISPFLGQRMELPMGNLRLLSINNSAGEKVQINDNFFEGMTKLNVLSIERVSLSSLPDTTQLLKNLRTLILDSCRLLETISVVGELINLEILSCRNCHSIKNLPREIGRLDRLKLLEFSWCLQLKIIEPGIISKLERLEELKMLQSFDKWEAENNRGKEGKNVGLRELQSLRNLTCLEIELRDFTLAAKHICLPSNMNFSIFVGDKAIRHRKMVFKKQMELNLPSEITLGNWIHNCARDAECMYLVGDGSHNLDMGQAQSMKSLTFMKCSKVKKLVITSSSIGGRYGTTTISPHLEYLKLDELNNLEEICDIDGPIPAEGSESKSFKNLKKLSLTKLPELKHLWKNSYQNAISLNNLSSIKISGCHNLRNLFPWAMANDFLLPFEKLVVIDCEKMEQLFLNQEENEKNIGQSHRIRFPKLKRLMLSDLPNLIAFCKGIESVEFPCLTETKITDCPQLKSLASTTATGNNQSAVSHFGNLSSIEINERHSLRNLSSLAMANDCLLQLERLEIRNCKMMEQVFLWNEEEENKKDIGQESRRTTIFPKFKSLRLAGLSYLTIFCKGSESIEFPVLSEMNIISCPQLKSLVSRSTSSSECGSNHKNSGGISHSDVCDDASLHLFCGAGKVAFGGLKTVQIDGYESSSSNTLFYCHQITTTFYTGLEELQIINCGNIRSLFLSSIVGNLCCLNKLSIHNCPEMVKVIEDEEENYSHVFGLEITDIFPKLRHLDLCNLPKLKSFCEPKCDLELQSLKDVRIFDCPQMKRFTLGSLTTPKLETIGFAVKEEESFYRWEAKLKGIETLEWKAMDRIAMDIILRDIRDEFSFRRAIDRRDEFSFSRVTDLLGSEQISFPSNTGQYDITMRDPQDFGFSLTGFEKKMHIHLSREIASGNWIDQCVRNVDYMLLDGKGSNKLELGEAQNMRLLIFRNCLTVKKLVNRTTSSIDDGRCGTTTVFPRLEFLQLQNLPELEEICDTDVLIPDDGSASNVAFKSPCQNVVSICSNLSSIEIDKCDSLCNLFSLPMANGCLLQLQRLRIQSCKMMEQVFFWNEEEENIKDIGQEGPHITVFLKLKTLSLHELPRLTTFCKGAGSIQFPLLTEVDIHDCPQLKSLASITSIGKNQSSVSLFSNLTSVKIKECHSLCNLSSLAMGIDRLLQLERLDIYDCKMMEQVFLWNEEKENKKDIGYESCHITAPKLKSLSLWGLPNLTSFCKGIESIEFNFPMLTKMTIEECPKLKIFVSSTTASSGCGNNQNNLAGISHDDDSLHNLHLFCKPKEVAFGSLKTVKIDGYESSSSNTLFCSQITANFFIGLEKLEIIKCGNIRSLISSSVARYLVHLKELSVHYCLEMVKVIADEEEAKYSHVSGCAITDLFPELQYLDLCELPKLKSFCEPKCALELQSLKDVRILDCPEMERFTLGSLITPRLETIGFAVKEEESFYGWEAKLKGIKTLEWEAMDRILRDHRDEFPFWSATDRRDEFTFSRVTDLLGSEQISFPSNIGQYDITMSDPQDFGFSLTGFEKKMHIHLPREIASGNWIDQCVRNVDYMLLDGKGSNKLDLEEAQNMRLLIFRNCSTVKKLVNRTTSSIDDGRCGTTTVFPHLEFLRLQNLPELEEICDTDVLIPDEGSTSNVAFKSPCQNVVSICSNLSSIEIDKCDSLCNLFSLAMANGCLLQLQRLQIRSCKMMEQVFSWNEEEENVNDIGQESPHVTVFLKLKTLSLDNLPRLTTFCKGAGSIQFPLLTEVNICDCPQLKSLASITSIGNNQSSVSLFSNPTSVKIEECHSLRNLSSLAMGIDRLLQLERLEIYDCKMMEQVFLWNEEKENKKDIGYESCHITAPKLKSLSLGDLPNLTSFCKGIESIEFNFPVLTEMTIGECPKLKNFVSSTTASSGCGNNQNNLAGISHDDDSLHLFCKPKEVVLCSLKELCLTGSMNTLIFGCHQIPIDFFTRLEKLEIWRCGGIRILFSSSIAQNLGNLRQLGISDCQQMAKVIGEDQEERDACSVEKTRLFRNLEMLQLGDLPHLKCFCEWKGSLELPSLKYVYIYNCPGMERYSLGSLTTPKLEKCYIDKKPLSNTKDLNNMLQQHLFTVKEREEMEEEREGEQEIKGEIEEEEI